MILQITVVATGFDEARGPEREAVREVHVRQIAAPEVPEYSRERAQPEPRREPVHAVAVPEPVESASRITGKASTPLYGRARSRANI